MGQGSGIPIIRKISNFTDLRILIVLGSILFSAGAVICGAAPTMNAFIIGRVFKGLAGAFLIQTTQQYVVMLCKPAEMGLVAGVIGLSWVVGLLVGPIIGALFAENSHLTWRWAFYILLPFLLVLVAPPAATIAPPPPSRGGRSFFENFIRLDWVGFLLHSTTLTLFCCSAVLSGLTWPWNSGAAISLWVLTGLVAIAYGIQQSLCLFTNPEHRLIPLEVFANRTVLLVVINTCMMAVGYAMSIYYTPLFFSFARGDGPVESAVHMLPLIGTFIAFVLLTGALLPSLRLYAAIYTTGGLMIVGAAGFLVTINASTPDSQVMGVTALLGAGVGLAFPIGISVNSVKLPKERSADIAMLNAMSLTIPSALTISVAGSIYENIGFHELNNALQPFGFTEADVRETLAGVSSRLSQAIDPKIRPVVAATVTRVIAKEFYILIAAGIVMVLASACMKWEALDIKGSKPAGETRTEEVLESAETHV